MTEYQKTNNFQKTYYKYFQLCEVFNLTMEDIIIFTFYKQFQDNKKPIRVSNESVSKTFYISEKKVNRINKKLKDCGLVENISQNPFHKEYIITDKAIKILSSLNTEEENPTQETPEPEETPSSPEPTLQVPEVEKSIKEQEEKFIEVVKLVKEVIDTNKTNLNPEPSVINELYNLSADIEEDWFNKIRNNRLSKKVLSELNIEDIDNDKYLGFLIECFSNNYMNNKTGEVLTPSLNLFLNDKTDWKSVLKEYLKDNDGYYYYEKDINGLNEYLSTFEPENVIHFKVM